MKILQEIIVKIVNVNRITSLNHNHLFEKNQCQKMIEPILYGLWLYGIVVLVNTCSFFYKKVDFDEAFECNLKLIFFDMADRHIFIYIYIYVYCGWSC